MLYIYEVQMSSAVRRKGLGSFLMRLLHRVACDLHMRKIMLTVHDANSAALALYKSLGYKLDVSSPDLDPEHPHGYQILCQDLPVKGITQPAAALPA